MSNEVTDDDGWENIDSEIYELEIQVVKIISDIL